MAHACTAVPDNNESCTVRIGMGWVNSGVRVVIGLSFNLNLAPIGAFVHVCGTSTKYTVKKKQR